MNFSDEELRLIRMALWFLYSAANEKDIDVGQAELSRLIERMSNEAKAQLCEHCHTEKRYTAKHCRHCYSYSQRLGELPGEDELVARGKKLHESRRNLPNSGE